MNTRGSRVTPAVFTRAGQGEVGETRPTSGKHGVTTHSNGPKGRTTAKHRRTGPQRPLTSTEERGHVTATGLYTRRSAAADACRYNWALHQEDRRKAGEATSNPHVGARGDGRGRGERRRRREKNKQTTNQTNLQTYKL